MKTETKANTEKKFDAVRFMREQRTRVSKIIERMSPEEELKYFQRKSKEFKETPKA